MGTLTQSHSWVMNRMPLIAKTAWGETNNNRSPKDSPPIEKKRARRQNNWLYQQQRAPLASLDDTIVNDASRVTSPLLQEEVRVRSKSLPSTASSAARTNLFDTVEIG